MRESRGGDTDPLDKNNMRGSSKWADRVDTILMLNRTKNLKGLPHTAWELQARMTMRQAEDIDDFCLHFNELGDTRVRFSRWKESQSGLPPLRVVNQPDRVKTTAGTQLAFDTTNPFG